MVDTSIPSSFSELESVIKEHKELSLGTRVMIKNLCFLISKSDEIDRHPELRGYVLMIDELTSKFHDNLDTLVFNQMLEKLTEQRELSTLAFQERILLLNNIDTLNLKLKKRDEYLQLKLDRLERESANAAKTQEDAKLTAQEARLKEIQAKADSILQRIEQIPQTLSQRDVNYDSNVHLTTIEKKVDYIYGFFNQSPDVRLLTRRRRRLPTRIAFQVHFAAVPHLRKDHRTAERRRGKSPI